MSRAELKLDIDLARELRYEEPDDVTVLEREQIDTRRWYSVHQVVFRLPGDERYWAWHYSLGLTENQEDEEISDWNTTAYEVFPVTRMVTAYVKNKPVDA